MGAFRSTRSDNIQPSFFEESGRALYIEDTFDEGMKVGLIERNKLSY